MLLGLSISSTEFKELEDSLHHALVTSSDGLTASQRYYIENRSRRLVYNIVRLNQNYLDVRTPGLDSELIDYALKLPWGVRGGAVLYRHIINRLDPGLAKIRYDKSGLPLLAKSEKSFSRRARLFISRNLNHLLPNRKFLLDIETGFGQCFRRSSDFRRAISEFVDGSEWTCSIFGAEVIQRLEVQRLRGRGVEDLVGMLVTLSALDRQGVGRG
jgi:hypothetical protein